MPNHCYTSPYYSSTEARAPEYYDWDWTVEWNKDVYQWDNYGSGEVDTQEETDYLLCTHDLTEADNSPASVTFNQGADIARGVGVTKGNALIFNALTNDPLDDYDSDLLNSDTFFDYFDNCLGYIDDDANLYAYRSLSQCLKTTPDSSTPGLNTLDNLYDLNDRFEDNWIQTSNYGNVVGIAKDGHVIFGPYNENGELWSCDDVDFCNGFFLSDTSYAYASTTFYPYTVGCWGPANGQLGEFTPSCTTNACGDAVSGVSLHLSAIAVGILALIS